MLGVLRCPNCSAPIEQAHAGRSVCPYCGVTLVDTAAPALRAVRLEEVGAHKYKLIAVLRDHVKLSLGDAKRLIETAPGIIAEGMEERLALALVAALEGAGARASVR